MPKADSKTREWEKERRNRLNEAFAVLCKLLPCYDPAINTSKIDILRHSSTYIEELQCKIKELTTLKDTGSTDTVKGEEVKKLQLRLKRLLNKNEMLCTLLRNAKITIPKACRLRRFQPPNNKWSYKILPEQAKIFQKKEAEEKENVDSPRKCVHKIKNKVTVQNGTPRHRKAILNRSENKKTVNKKKKNVKGSSKCVIVLSQQSITQPYYVITKAPSNILGSTSTVVSSSSVITNPVVSPKVTKPISSTSGLGPGTLILANGTIIPIVPQPQTVVPVIRPSVFVIPKTTTTSIVCSTSIVTTTATTTAKSLPKLRPKYCLTKTTQINKVPIPALTSRYSSNEVLKKSEEKAKKVPLKETQKKVTTAACEKEKVKVVVTSEEPAAKKPKTVEEPKTVVEEKVNEPAVVKEAVLEKEPLVEGNKKPADVVDLNLNHSELSNDIFASLQVPAGCQNPESTSPTAAFLLAFPLVSSLTGVKVAEVNEDDNCESHSGTPTLLQIGTMDTTKPTQSESLTPSLLNLDNLSFFSSKEINSFYNFDGIATKPPTSTNNKTFESFGRVPEEIVPKVQTYEVPKVDKAQVFDVPKLPTTESLVPKPFLYNNAPVTTSAVVTKSYNSFDIVSVTRSGTKNEDKLLYQVQHQQKPVVHHQQITQQHHQKTDLNPCFDQRSSNFNNAGYQAKTVGKQENKQCDGYIQKNFNNFNEIRITSYANTIKNYPEPLYTNSNTSYNYSYPSDMNFNQNYYKNFSKPEGRSYPLTYNNYSNFTSANATSNYYTNVQKTQPQKAKNPGVSRAPINWMTTPDNRTEYGGSQFSKENDFSGIYPPSSQPSYFNSNVGYSNTNEVINTTKSLDLPLVPPVSTYQRHDIDENQFSWSPTKMPQFLEPAHSFISSSLPTLVGDLALGNPLNFSEQKNEKCVKKERSCRRRYETGNQNHSNFSVSQLVDHGKESVPARAATTRRNSGNRTSGKSKLPSKTTQRKEQNQKVDGKAFGTNEEIFCEAKRSTKNSYSAESLIGHQMQPDVNQKKHLNYTGNKTLPVAPFLHDNIIPYFPSMELPSQDNSYMQQNQNYHNFSSNSYTSNTLIPSTTTYNFMHDAPSHDLSENLNLFPNKTCGKTIVKKDTFPQPEKKVKRKTPNDLPAFVDFPFLSMPGAINSPILPDDFHTHTSFLQPPTSQLYSCKNPFTKSNELGPGGLLPLPPVGGTRTQHPEISPSINNAGTSFANFNLCTIMPEINGSNAVPEPYLETGRVRDQRSYSSAAQVPFNNKPPLSFGYINNNTSQSYNNQ